MADRKISAHTALTGANTAAGDLTEIVDVSDVTDGAGGTNKKITRDEMRFAMTQDLKDYTEVRTGPSISSGTLTLDFNNGNVFEVSLTENITTLTISNPAASGTMCSAVLILTQDATGGRTVAWHANAVWNGGAAATVSSAANASDVYTLFTVDGGTTYYFMAAGQAFA